MQLLQRLLEQGLLTEDDVPRINEAQRRRSHQGPP